MRLLPRPRVLAAAAILIVLHLLMWWRVVAENIQYDAGDVSWWLVAFLVLPIAATVLLVGDFIRILMILKRKGRQ